MNSFFLVAAAAEGEPQLFGINVGVSFWTLIIFLLLLAVLMKFAFPPILGYAAAREQRIQSALDEARRLREEAESQLEQQRQALVAARQEAQTIITDAKTAGERVREDVLARARTEQEELIARARRDIERERDQALEALRREAVEIALAAAGRLIGERMDAATDRKVVTDYLAAVGGSGRPVGAA